MFESILGFLKRHKRAVAVLLLIVALERKYRIRAHLQEGKRRAALFKVLPGPPTGGSNEHWLLGHMASTAGLAREGEVITPDNLPNVMISRLVELAERYKSTSDLFRIYALNSALPTNKAGFIVVFGIDTAREVLSHKGMDSWHKGMAYEISSVLIGNSVLKSHGEIWLRQRAAMEKGMTHNVMEAAMPRVLQTVNELCAKLEKIAITSRNSAEINVPEECLKLTLDVIGRAAFSHDFGSVTATKTADAPLYTPFQVILSTLNRRCNTIYDHHLRFLPTEANRNFDAAMDKLSTQCSKIIETRKAPKGDLLDILMENRDTAKGLPTKLILDNVHTMLFAGHDTTGAALTWMLRLLAAHPEHMLRVRKEIIAKIGTNGDPSYQDLEELDFVNAVVLETLRLYPSAAFTRENDHDVYLANGKYVIPAGSQVMIVPYIIHRDERYWDRPNDFVPERFLYEELDKNVQDKRGNSLQSRIGRISSKKAYLPFSLGPRNCVGRPLALMEMRTVLVKLLQRFSFELPKDTTDFNPVPLFQLTLNPDNVKLVPIVLNDH